MQSDLSTVSVHLGRSTGCVVVSGWPSRGGGLGRRVLMAAHRAVLDSSMAVGGLCVWRARGFLPRRQLRRGAADADDADDDRRRRRSTTTPRGGRPRHRPRHRPRLRPRLRPRHRRQQRRSGALRTGAARSRRASIGERSGIDLRLGARRRSRAESHVQSMT